MWCVWRSETIPEYLKKNTHTARPAVLSVLLANKITLDKKKKI